MRRALLVLVLALPALASPALADQSLTLHVGTRADGSMYASPSAMSATAGERITFTVVNDDVDASGKVTTPHDIKVAGQSMPRAGGDCAAAAGGEEGSPGAEFEVCDQASATGTFTAVAGSFKYDCEVPGHEAKGMKGRLEVQAASGGAAKTPGPELPLVLGGLLLVALARRRA